MKNLRVFIVLLGSVFLTSLTFAEIPPPLKDVKVSAVTSWDRKSAIYTYTYEVYNPPVNILSIYSFNIDIKSGPFDATLGSEGLPSGPCYLKSSEEYFLKQIKMVPIGMDVPPGDMLKYFEVGGKVASIWSCGLSLSGFAGWGANDEPYLIPPGQKLGGFKLTSYGLPGIRDTIVKQDYVMDEEDVPEEVDEEDRLKEYLDSVYSSIAFHGKTLGPVAPPADFKSLAFLDYIISLKHEAAKLGWIKNEGIINSLDKKLENAKKAIERNSIGSAKNVLNAFINEVEAQGCETYDKCPEGKHLTPEGYGLLKYNVEYLIDKL